LGCRFNGTESLFIAGQVVAVMELVFDRVERAE
jgi:hypothetical protein